MATYPELFGLMGTESGVKNKVKVALVISAKTICDELDTVPNHILRKAWALAVLNGIDGVAEKAWPILVASFRTQTVDAIKVATDAAVQSAVDANINFLAGV